MAGAGFACLDGGSPGRSPDRLGPPLVVSADSPPPSPPLQRPAIPASGGIVRTSHRPPTLVFSSLGATSWIWGRTLIVSTT
eukprot:18795-Chlamydomonas_euryale.AAC.2